MIELGISRKNDVFRAQGHKHLALFHINMFIAGEEEHLFLAKEAGAEFLQWAESLHNSRGDIFPFSDALLIGAKCYMFDRPDTSLNYVASIFQLGLDFGDEPIPAHMREIIDDAKAIVNQINRMMHERRGLARHAREEGDVDRYLSYMLYTYRASAALGEARIAAEIALELAEFFSAMGESEIASQWASAAAMWKGEEIQRKSND
ncbi:MAG TPA: hypothetical protein ENN07_03130 [candidate division Zixibacteria bacterium]|nr:hypothetical protein [candidate division Zixibacteria bacterium]